MINWLFALLLFPTLLLAQNVPTDTSSKLKMANEVRFFWLKKSFQHMLEIKQGEWEDDVNFLSFKAGSRYRLSKNLKLGVFLQRSYGLRHDDDWVKTTQWQWRDRKSQGQDILIVDSSYKNFLNSKMTYELRAAVEKNVTVGRDFFKPRIGLSYFLPKSHLILSHELSIPLEKRDQLIQENWTYLIYSYHYSQTLSFGPLIGRRSVTWESSESFKNVTGDKYKLDETNYHAGLNLTCHFE